MAWIPVDQEISLDVTKMNVRGRQVPIRISPFDIPEAFRVVHDSQRSVIRIEFRYPDEEPGKPRLSDGDLAVVVGKFSEKVLALEIRRTRGRVASVFDQAISALQRISDVAPPSALMNYKAIDAVLSRNKENLARAATEVL